MKLIRTIATAAAALVVTITPSFARVEEGTGDLLRTLDDNGISVVVNNERCTGEFLGTYRFIGMKRQMTLCPGETIDAIDHATVRHETWHAIQHCVNTARGTASNTPVAEDMDELRQLVNTYVPAETVQWIYESYPEDHWLIELEANAVERSFTATELEDLFLKACSF